MPQPSATIGVRGCRLPALKGLKRSADTFDQALRPQPSATIGVRGCRLLALKGLKRSAAPSTRHSGHSHLLLSAFEAAVCAALKGLKRIRRRLRPEASTALRPQLATIAFEAAVWQTLKGLKCCHRQLRPGTQATAICYYRRSRLPFARPQRPKTLNQALKPEPSATIGVRGCRLPRPQRLNTHPRQLRPGTQATAICYYRRSRLPFARPQRPKTLRGSFDQARNPQPSATIGVRGCRLRALKGLKPSAEASTGSVDQALRPQPSATIGIRGCRLAALKGLKCSTAASTRHAGHSHLLLSAFEAAVCPPSKA